MSVRGWQCRKNLWKLLCSADVLHERDWHRFSGLLIWKYPQLMFHLLWCVWKELHLKFPASTMKQLLFLLHLKWLMTVRSVKRLVISHQGEFNKTCQSLSHIGVHSTPYLFNSPVQAFRSFSLLSFFLFFALRHISGALSHSCRCGQTFKPLQKCCHMWVALVEKNLNYLAIWVSGHNLSTWKKKKSTNTLWQQRKQRFRSQIERFWPCSTRKRYWHRLQISRLAWLAMKIAATQWQLTWSWAKNINMCQDRKLKNSEFSSLFYSTKLMRSLSLSRRWIKGIKWGISCLFFCLWCSKWSASAFLGKNWSWSRHFYCIFRVVQSRVRKVSVSD